MVRITNYWRWTTKGWHNSPCEQHSNPLQCLLFRLSYKHFLLLLCAKHQKKGDMGFHRCCKMSVCARNGIKRGPNSLFPTEVSGLLPSHWIVRHKPLDSWWFSPLEDKKCNRQHVETVEALYATRNKRCMKQFNGLSPGVLISPLHSPEEASQSSAILKMAIMYVIKC